MLGCCCSNLCIGTILLPKLQGWVQCLAWDADTQGSESRQVMPGEHRGFTGPHFAHARSPGPWGTPFPRPTLSTKPW